MQYFYASVIVMMWPIQFLASVMVTMLPLLGVVTMATFYQELDQKIKKNLCRAKIRSRLVCLLTIYAPMIYTAPRVMFLMRADG
jgi:hypothetical protein